MEKTMTKDDYLFYRSVDIKPIIAFLAVVNMGGVIPAAMLLECSPAAISSQLARLRQHYPEQLFTREGRRLELTAAGEVLHRRLSRTLGRLRRYIDIPIVH